MKLFLTAAPGLSAVDGTLKDIFASPAFSKREGLVDRIVRAIVEFFQWLGFRIGADSGLSRLVVLLGAFVLVGVLFAAVFLSLKNARRGVSLKQETGVAGHAESLAEALELVRFSESREAYSEALVFLFIAYLHDLREKGFLKLSDGKTNRQYRYELKSAGYPELLKFEDFARDYAGVRFGDIDPGRDGFFMWKDRFLVLFYQGVGS